MNRTKLKPRPFFGRGLSFTLILSLLELGLRESVLKLLNVFS